MAVSGGFRNVAVGGTVERRWQRAAQGESREPGEWHAEGRGDKISDAGGFRQAPERQVNKEASGESALGRRSVWSVT